MMVENDEVRRPQKQKFKHLDDVVNLESYDKPEQTETKT